MSVTEYFLIRLCSHVSVNPALVNYVLRRDADPADGFTGAVFDIYVGASPYPAKVYEAELTEGGRAYLEGISI